MLATFVALTAVSANTVSSISSKEITGLYKDADIPALAPEVYNMNADWKFFQPAKDQKQGPLSSALDFMKRGEHQFYDISYDDSGWENVSIPHPFNAGDMYQNKASSGGDRGIYQGIVFYRKTFALPKGSEGKKAFIEFEGIRMAAYVYLNGELLGYYEAGIAAFGFDLSAGKLFYDKPNVLAVAVDNRGGGNTTGNTPPANNSIRETKPGSPAGAGDGSGFQWSGMDFNPVQGGLNRNVTLYLKNPVFQTLPLYRNLRTQGTYIYPSEVDASSNSAVINVEADVRNESSSDRNIGLDVVLVNADGKITHQYKTKPQSVPRAGDIDQNAKINMTAVPADYSLTEERVDIRMRQTTVIKASFKAEDIKLWSTDVPYLYDVYAILKDGNDVIDVVKITTGFRKVEYKGGLDGGVYINDRFVWLSGYAQRSTNAWASLGIAPDWLQDYDMALFRSSNANFVRWMHVAPQPASIRSGDRYGIVAVCPAGDKESGNINVRTFNQRMETMRDVILYFRNNPSVFFWEAGNSDISADRMRQMTELRRQLDPSGMRAMGCRSIRNPEQGAQTEWIGTMLGRQITTGFSNYTTWGKHLVTMHPIVETEYTRGESPRRIWDRFSPPDFDYRNYFTGTGGATPKAGRDAWDYTQEEFVVANVAAYNEYYSRMINTNSADPIYSAIAAIQWADMNEMARQTATETGRMSGRVDAVRLKKPSFYAYQTMQSKTPAVYLVGHWNYPANYEDYKYFVRNDDYTYSTTETRLRDAKNKTIYAVASNVASVELFVNGVSKGVNDRPVNHFLYQWSGIDITQHGDIMAVGYDASGKEVTGMKIETTGEPAGLRLTPVAGPAGLRADGSDVAYFDIEVVDAQGRVCPLSYDRINFSLEGPATMMGGHNSGAWVLPEWKNGYNKSYIYAECGTNRLLIKAGREAGKITLKARLDGGKEYTASLTSVPFTATGGLTKVMPQIMTPNLRSLALAAQQTQNYVAGSNFTTADREETTSTRVVEISINGSKLNYGNLKAYNYGTGAFAPALITLDALKSSGTNYRYDESSQTITITRGSVTVSMRVNESAITIKQPGSADEEVILNDMPALIDGVLYIELDAPCRFLGYNTKWEGDLYLVTKG